MNITINRRITAMLWLGLLVMGAVACSNTSNAASDLPDSAEWTWLGETNEAGSVDAIRDEKSGHDGVSVLFLSDDEAGCQETYIFEEHVEVWFREYPDGFGRPTSIHFFSGGGMTEQEARGLGYDGSLELDGDQVSGYIDAERIGLEEDASISGTFEAKLCD